MATSDLHGNLEGLDPKGAEIGGVKFYGTPWVPIISYSWAFEGEHDTLVSWFSKIPSGIDVLVTHSPPRIPDSDVDRSLQTDSEHFGSPELTETIIEKRHRFVFCGHIHTGRNRRASGAATHRDAAKPSEASAEHGGVDFEGSRIYNFSRLDERYEIAYEPTWVEV